jgi:hypothetical protein
MLGLGVQIQINSNSVGNEFISVLANEFKQRVAADSGITESLECINDADFSLYNWGYYFRVIDDLGVVESLECITI